MGDDELSQEQNYYSAMFSKIKDLEDKQRIIKDRTLLVGENLIEFNNEIKKDIIEIKKQLEKFRMDFERMKSFIETISNEFPKFAKKDDIETLRKFIKMISPLISREEN